LTKLLARSVAAALLTAGALAAHANPVDIQVTQSLGALADTALDSGNLAGGKTFAEFFQFSLATDSALSWGVTASIAGRTGLASLSSSLYSGTLASLAGSPLAIGISDGSSASALWTSDPGTMELADLAGGDYTLVISGKTLAGGGAFGGTLTATPIAPVPEPDTYAMFIAGLGILGAIARRGRPINLARAPKHAADEEMSL